MSVIQTDKWLINNWKEPLKLTEELSRYFSEASPTAIYDHLTMHGMYQLPFKNGWEDIEHFIDKNPWETVSKQEMKLRKLWKGPTVPIFIFPADTNNRALKENFNGKSGVAFRDKLFLFISQDNSEQEIKALFTHEYHHVTRMSKFKKSVSTYHLLDTIILEGLAEHAVKEQIGEAYNADWTNYYSTYQLEKMWKRLIQPAGDLPKQHRRHHLILYGSGLYPKMAGYAVGYYLVNNYVDKNNLSSHELLSISTDDISRSND